MKIENKFKLPAGLKLDEESLNLWKKIHKLHVQLRDYTKKRYNRVNPFVEDLFEWEEKGRFFGGKNVTIYDSTTITGDVEIGDNTWIGTFCSINGTGGLKIGKFCSISTGVRILTHDTVKWALSGGKCEYEYAPVSIGDYCFIGVETVVLKGVRIGEHCLVAANSLVTKSFPNNSIIAGMPARKIGKVIVENDDVRLEYFDN